MKTKIFNKPIAIQGGKGSYHHKVAQDYFNSKIEVVECETFDKAVEQLLTNRTDFMIMALENSIVGPILVNYALIDVHQLQIIGEYYLDIQHQLMALPGQTIRDIKEVYSHPMALLQCKAFFRKYPHIKLVEAQDTALSAQTIFREKIKARAAIASKTAASIFGLDILASNIQTIKRNETRFAIVNRNENFVPVVHKNKASLKFELDHKRGSLAAILNVMSDCRLSLTKIQSLPKIETPWKYAFFADVTFSNFSDYKKALNIMKLMAENIKVLGEYKNQKL